MRGAARIRLRCPLSLRDGRTSAVRPATGRGVSRGFGVDLPHEGAIHVTFDDSTIVDTYQEKKQGLSEVGVTMTVAEFRQKVLRRKAPLLLNVALRATEEERGRSAAPLEYALRACPVCRLNATVAVSLQGCG